MPNLGQNFYPKLVKISSELGMKPEDLLAIMVSESGINPSAVEKKFKGSGLMGFMPSTLKALGFKGSWEDFVKLSGEEQLDYVEKLVRSNMNLNGGPFTSAAQYYVANLWPIALKLPGIRHGDPNTAFIEENPETITDPKTGKVYSKKYYDIGFKISPNSEAGAYRANPLFHGNIKGAITYGDMMRQIEKNKSSSLYRKAIDTLNHFTGYLPKAKTIDPSMKDAPLEDVLDFYLQQVAASEKLNDKLYKKFLPSNHLVIGIDAPDYTTKVEFARILCATLDEELLSKSCTHTNDNEVEVECLIHGPQEECIHAVEQITEAVTDAFYHATIKIGGVKIKPSLFINKKSSYNQISFEKSSLQYRKFLLKFI